MIREKFTCLGCKKESNKTGLYQKYCGSKDKKIGCSYKNHVHWPKEIGRNKDRVYKEGDKRTRVLKLTNNKCSKCGLESLIKGFLDVDHIDGNHANGKIENLQVLCPNCHRIKTMRERGF